MSERYADRDFVEISQGQIGKVIGTKGANGFFCMKNPPQVNSHGTEKNHGFQVRNLQGPPGWFPC